MRITCAAYARPARSIRKPSADEAGVHRTYVSDLERAARNPTIRVVESLAGALGVTVSELLS